MVLSTTNIDGDEADHYGSDVNRQETDREKTVIVLSTILTLMVMRPITMGATRIDKRQTERRQTLSCLLY